MKKKVNLAFLAIAIVLLIFNVSDIDISDLSWVNSRDTYLRIISNILLIMLFVSNFRKFSKG
jgi:hypothetical protein